LVWLLSEVRSLDLLLRQRCGRDGDNEWIIINNERPDQTWASYSNEMHIRSPSKKKKLNENEYSLVESR
jgi:hypothetical protein